MRTELSYKLQKEFTHCICQKTISKLAVKKLTLIRYLCHLQQCWGNHGTRLQDREQSWAMHSNNSDYTSLVWNCCITNIPERPSQHFLQRQTSGVELNSQHTHFGEWVGSLTLSWLLWMQILHMAPPRRWTNMEHYKLELCRYFQNKIHLACILHSWLVFLLAKICSFLWPYISLADPVF